MLNGKKFVGMRVHIQIRSYEFCDTHGGVVEEREDGSKVVLFTN